MIKKKKKKEKDKQKRSYPLQQEQKHRSGYYDTIPDIYDLISCNYKKSFQIYDIAPNNYLTSSNSYDKLSNNHGFCLSVGWLVGWIFSRITQKLLNGFTQILDGGWVSAQNMSPWSTVDSNAVDGRSLDELIFRMKEIVLTFFIIVRESVLRVILPTLDEENEVYLCGWYQASTI